MSHHASNDCWRGHWKIDHHQRGVSIWLTRDAPGSDAPGQPGRGIHPSISHNELFADPDGKTKEACLCNMTAPEKTLLRDIAFDDALAKHEWILWGRLST